MKPGEKNFRFKIKRKNYETNRPVVIEDVEPILTTRDVDVNKLNEKAILYGRGYEPEEKKDDNIKKD